MPDALIGHSGFVGGNLLRQRTFDALFRSNDIDQIAGRAFDTIVCAGAPAEKWKANRDPEADRASLNRLREALQDVKARRFVLISTVDVFARPIEVYEESPVEHEGLHAYGRHRHELERYIAGRFDSALVVRLPGLFGPGLKKNVIFDLLHNNQIDKIDSRGIFQFYGLEDLWTDIETALSAGLKLVHLTTEPVSVAEVARLAFDREFQNEPAGATPARYDFRTKHAAKFGREGPYLADKAEVLEAIRRFVVEVRRHG